MKELYLKGKRIVKDFINKHIVEAADSIKKAQLNSLTDKKNTLQDELLKAHTDYSEVLNDYCKEVELLKAQLEKTPTDLILLDSQKFIENRFKRYESKYFLDVRNQVQLIKGIDDFAKLHNIEIKK